MSHFISISLSVGVLRPQYRCTTFAIHSYNVRSTPVLRTLYANKEH
ncbi:hypothetical protein HMPREF0645_2291 [Hallella bergensis DSM 17361]|uniref:Uncharacterized protein n=1 Tax=Hallella bergensis DSM 17361 TaxID=585502 RepID=D1PZA6_9BACT|nr:hypothetical protein HMPREF0645_2291 [Hallella bergensis DSM 17361]